MGRYVGAAGEYFVMAELLAQEFNVMCAAIDEGIDLVAFKPSSPNRLFRLQIKTSNRVARGSTRNADRHAFSLSREAYEREKDHDDFFVVLVCRVAQPGTFLPIVLPVDDLTKLIADDYVRFRSRRQQHYSLLVYIDRNNNTPTLGSHRRGSDVSKYKTAWDLLTP